LEVLRAEPCPTAALRLQRRCRNFTLERQMSKYKMEELKWMPASMLPPVQCPLLINVNGSIFEAHRETWVVGKDSVLTFVLKNGFKLEGRFPWTYP